jgi:hypothetical protein
MKIQKQICEYLEGKEKPCCVDCGEQLSKTEILNDEDTCYPCQKGNR